MNAGTFELTVVVLLLKICRADDGIVGDDDEVSVDERRLMRCVVDEVKSKCKWRRSRR